MFRTGLTQQKLDGEKKTVTLNLTKITLFKVASNQTATLNIRNGSNEKHFHGNSLTSLKLLHRFVTFPHKMVCLQDTSAPSPTFYSKEIN